MKRGLGRQPCSELNMAVYLLPSPATILRQVVLACLPVSPLLDIPRRIREPGPTTAVLYRQYAVKAKIALDLTEQVHEKASGIALIRGPSGQNSDRSDPCLAYLCVEWCGLDKVELGINILAQPRVVGLWVVLVHHELDGLEGVVVQDGDVGLARNIVCRQQLIDMTRNKG